MFIYLRQINILLIIKLNIIKYILTYYITTIYTQY
jgi:hypothetical protein